MVNKLKKALLAPDKKETNNISTNEDIAVSSQKLAHN